MFTKNPQNNMVDIVNEHKIRFISVHESNYAKFLNKIRSRKNLYVADYSLTKGNVVTLKLYNKDFPVKREKYDVRGKNFEIIEHDYSVVMKEVTFHRNDGFFVDDYLAVDNYLLSFIENKKFYKENNLLHKAGILLYGPPGNGKSSYIRYLYLNKILPESTIYIWCKTLPTKEQLNEFAKIDALKVFIFEEITTTLKQRLPLSEFLQFCDGENSIDNSVVMCMTNHPELLPQNLTNRPSRFNRIVEFKNPNNAARETILKLYFKDAFVPEMIQLTSGLSFDQIKESYIISVTENISFESAIKSVKIHKQKVEDSFSSYKKIGFSSDEE